MADKFTITLEYDRDEILALVDKAIGMGGSLNKTKDMLSLIYPAWDRDTVTSCKVELMFRGEGDVFYELFVDRLAWAENKRGL